MVRLKAGQKRYILHPPLLPNITNPISASGRDILQSAQESPAKQASRHFQLQLACFDASQPVLSLTGEDTSIEYCYVHEVVHHAASPARQKMISLSAGKEPEYVPLPRKHALSQPDTTTRTAWQ
jgi:hypothetical protein